MKGGPIDLTPFGAVVNTIAIAYWVFVAVLIYFALRLPKNKPIKFISVVIVLVVFSVMPVRTGWQAYQARKTLNTAMARFEMRCKTAGEKILRRVDNVDGIFLMKIRREDTNDRQPSQFKLDDPYGKDFSGDAYIKSFLRDVTDVAWPGGNILHGFQYVEAVDPEDGKRYRFKGWVDEVWKRNPERYAKNYTIFKLEKTPARQPFPRYGVTYDDISSKEDRNYWIAGSSLRVIDLQTNEVIAERIGYMIDKGQGSKAGFRDPWLFATANACPSFPYLDTTIQIQQTRRFVEKVLKPIEQIK